MNKLNLPKKQIIAYTYCPYITPTNSEMQKVVKEVQSEIEGNISMIQKRRRPRTTIIAKANDNG